MPHPLNPAPRVSSRHGAPMGRMGEHVIDADTQCLYLTNVPLDSGGYDAGGAYWGLGKTLYYVEDTDGNSTYLRARSLGSAVQDIRDDTSAGCPIHCEPTASVYYMIEYTCPECGDEGCGPSDQDDYVHCGECNQFINEVDNIHGAEEIDCAQAFTSRIIPADTSDEFPD